MKKVKNLTKEADVIDKIKSKRLESAIKEDICWGLHKR